MNPTRAKTVTPADLQALLLQEPAAELALLDVRETRWFVQRHPNLARNAPFSGLELQVGTLVPRRSTPVVLYDDYNAPDGVAQAATAVLARLGYTDVRTLDGGLQRWVTEGLPAIDGYGTLVKAFGDRARLHYGTPALPIEALRARQREGRPTTLVDARPRAEFEFPRRPARAITQAPSWRCAASSRTGPTTISGPSTASAAPRHRRRDHAAAAGPRARCSVRRGRRHGLGPAGRTDRAERSPQRRTAA